MICGEDPFRRRLGKSEATHRRLAAAIGDQTGVVITLIAPLVHLSADERAQHR